MDMDKDEITEELAHHKEMLRLYRRRLRELERKQAQYGINTPAEVITEIHDLTESIQRHVSETARLRTEAAVDQLSIAEAEYRALVAKAWATPEGRPTIVGATQLEFDRLRLGVTPERAQKLELELRVALCKEYLSDFNEHELLDDMVSVSPPNREAWDNFMSVLHSLKKGIQLNHSTVISWFMEAAKVDSDSLPDIAYFIGLHEDKVLEFTDDTYWLHDAFLYEWAEAIASFES
jgi:hypothetical protein